MMKKGIAVFLGLWALTACSKEPALEQNTYVDNPVFYLNATVDGLPINLAAGQDGYAMYTGYQVQDSVLHMQGIMAADSPDFKQAIYIDLRGAELVANYQSPSALNTFLSGPIPLSDPSGEVVEPFHYDYQFFSDSVNGHIPIMWSVLDTSYYGDSCGLPAVDIRSHPQLKVSMSSAGPLSCTPLVKHTINTESECKAKVEVIQSSGTQLKAKAIARLGKIASVDWFMGSQKIASGINLNYQASGHYVNYNLKAVVKFESGCQETIEKVIMAGGTDCDINMNYRRVKHRVSNPHNLRTVEIRYYDAEGKMYSSWYPNSQGRFNIEALSGYRDANSVYDHHRFSFSGEAILKSSDGSSVQLNNIFGIFALAHP